MQVPCGLRLNFTSLIQTANKTCYIKQNITNHVFIYSIYEYNSKYIIPNEVCSPQWQSGKVGGFFRASSSS